MFFKDFTREMSFVSVFSLFKTILVYKTFVICPIFFSPSDIMGYQPRPLGFSISPNIGLKGKVSMPPKWFWLSYLRRQSLLGGSTKYHSRTRYAYKPVGTVPGPSRSLPVPWGRGCSGRGCPHSRWCSASRPRHHGCSGTPEPAWEISRRGFKSLQGQTGIPKETVFERAGFILRLVMF